MSAMAAIRAWDLATAALVSDGDFNYRFRTYDPQPSACALILQSAWRLASAASAAWILWQPSALGELVIHAFMHERGISK